jgi:excisionase family DNA binding protein
MTATDNAERGRFVTGATIGKALGVSPITVRRMIEDGRLKAFRIGGNTSPWKVWLSDIERIRGNRARAELGE